MKRIKYDVPRWHVFLHRDARGLGRAERDDPLRVRFEDELFERLFAGEPEVIPEADQSENRAWAERIHEAASKLPDFARLASQCRGDPDAAATAVESLLMQLKPLLDEQKDTDDRALRTALRQGCSRAAVAVEEQRDACEGLSGVGFAPGSSRGSGGPQEAGLARTLARRLKDDGRLRQIALLAGRFRRILARKKREKVRHGADDLADVETGSDLGRLLPVELAKLMHPKARLAMLRDLTEGTAMQYRLTGRETKGKGPLVVCLDKSGSMQGSSDIWATAVALALLDIAHRERRPFGVLCFDSHVRYEVLVKSGEALPADMLTVACSGGTDIHLVLGRALQVIAENPGALRKADVVLITDGQSETTLAEQIRTRARELGASILGFGIGVPAAVLEDWCDHVQAVTDLSRLDENTAEALAS